MEIKNFNVLVSRHSKKPRTEDQESPEYPGISKEGVEYSVRKSQEIIDALEQAESGTIFVFAGISEEARTRSTGNIYIENIKKIIKDRGDLNINILDEEMIRDPKKGPSGIVRNLAEEIAAHPEQKYIIHFPLILKQNTIGSRWMAEDGKSWSPYVLKMFEMNNNDADKAFREWLKNEGEFAGLNGPNPLEEAELQIRGIARLRSFVEKHLRRPRPIIIGGVGHSWTIDAMLVYLANNGKVTPEGFDKIGGKLISESNFAKIETRKNGKIFLKYNGNEYEVDSELIERI